MFSADDPKNQPDEIEAEQEPTPEKTASQDDDAPIEVLPPDDEEKTPSETPEHEEQDEDAPISAEEWKRKLAEKDQEIASLKRTRETPDEDAEADEADAAPAAEKPQTRVNMGQVFMKKVAPTLRKDFLDAKEQPEEQFNVLVDTANQLVGAVLQDSGIINEKGTLRNVSEDIHRLAAANVELMNEIEIRDLRSDPEFKQYEPKVRVLLRKASWKERSTVESTGEGIVTALFHRLRGAKTNGKPKESDGKVPKTPTQGETVRRVLKDISAGTGGASPRHPSVRLTREQEADYQELLSDGIELTRAEYYAKWKARADQAKVANKKIPATYRG